jgi:hypothetical protein
MKTNEGPAPKSQKQIYNEAAGTAPGTPPPMMSAEGQAIAEKLGAGLSFEVASGSNPPAAKTSEEKALPTGNDPASKNYGPQSATSLSLKTPMMSEAGDRMSKRTAPGRACDNARIPQADAGRRRR